MLSENNNSTEKVRTNIGLSRELWERLKIRSIKDNITLSETVEKLLRDAFGKEKT